MTMLDHGTRRGQPISVGLLGYGEVGRILAEDFHRAGIMVAGYDRLLDDAAASVDVRSHADQHHVRLVESAQELGRGVDLVISVVTAGQAVAAAESCTAGIREQLPYLDLNSVAPGSKNAAANRIGRAGGCYVEGAVMAPVPPQRSKVPILVGGPHAQQQLPLLAELGLNVSFCSERLGVAAATKMCRSMVIKGLEAIMVEALATARSWQIEDAVLRSLVASYPGVDWDEQATYFFHRVGQHGRRRADEMREAASTAREAGLPGAVADGAATVQQWATALLDGASTSNWRSAADAVLAATYDGSTHDENHEPAEDDS